MQVYSYCMNTKTSQGRKINPSRLRRNARRLRHFLERKLSSGNTSVSGFIQQCCSSNSMNCQHGSDRTSRLRLLISRISYVLCVDFVIKEGQPSLELDLASDNHVWTPVQVKKPKSLSDEPAEHQTDDIPSCIRTI